MVTNTEENKSYSFELTDEMYNGTKGLEIKTTGVPYRWMLVTKIVNKDCDYVKICESIESELDDTPATDGIDKASLYKTLRNYFTSYENETYPISTKMSNWLSKLPETILQADGTADGCYLASSNNTVLFRKDYYDHAFDGTGSFFGGAGNCTLDRGSWIAQIPFDLSSSFGYFSLRVEDFSKYQKVEFAMGFGGNDGGVHSPKYALGEVASGTTITDDANYIGQGFSTYDGTYGKDGINWNNADELKVTISNGKISFNGTHSGINKTLDLDNDVYTGKKALSFTVTGVKYEYFAISPLIGYYL